MFYNYTYERIKDISVDNVLLYLRKSRSDDPLMAIEEVLSKHETILDEWTSNNLGGTVPEHNRYREVVSGETIKDRPEIQKLLRAIESPKIKAIAIVEPQRLTRGDLEDIGKLMKLLKHSNTWVITPQRIYDLADEYDWDAFERELKRGNEYLEYTKKILNRGRLYSVSQGNYLGSIAPYGYEKITITEGNKKHPTLKIVEEQANVVRMIYDMYVNENMGKNNIAHKLDDMGIKPPKGDKWSPAALRDMLANVHYIGKVKWNWRKTVKVVEDSEIIDTRPKAKEYLIFDGKHEAIISDELFASAREKQGRNHRAKANTKVRNPLAGLLWCRCGRAMSLRTYHNKGEKIAEPRLVCDNQVHCNTGSVVYTDLIDKLSGVIQQSIADFKIILKNNDVVAHKMHIDLIARLEKRMKELEEKELAQWEAQADPDISKRMPQHIFKALNERLQKEKAEVSNALHNARESMPKQIDYEEKIVLFKDALDALYNEDMPALKRNLLLKQCIERIDYTRERPQRIRSTSKRINVNGRKIKPDALLSGANWTNPPFEIDVKLRV